MGGSGKRAGSVPTVLVLIILFLPQVILCLIYLCSMETNGVGVLIFFSSLPYSFLITVSRLFTHKVGQEGIWLTFTEQVTLSMQLFRSVYSSVGVFWWALMWDNNSTLSTQYHSFIYMIFSNIREINSAKISPLHSWSSLKDCNSSIALVVHGTAILLSIFPLCSC